MFQLAHLSDLHATPVRVRRMGDLLNKRALGWLSWSLRRSKEHRQQTLAALIDDLHRAGPDHVAVTGDLTNLGMEEELDAATHWLKRLGDSAQVSVVPGNHDAYVSGAPSPWAHWQDYMGDSPASAEADGNGMEFPSVRIRGPVALVCVSSARPTPPFVATGRVGRWQRERLERILAELRSSDLCRVVLIHHPPTRAELSARRRLTDAPAVRSLLARAGAELVLHGHTHRSTWTSLDGPKSVIPVIGVPSASAVGQCDGRRARYHIYRIETRRRSGECRWRISCSVRGFDRARGRFVPEGERPL